MKLSWFRLVVSSCLVVASSLACTSFYCLNSCGDYKLIVANNRDEDIYRLTVPAGIWPPKTEGGKNNLKLSASSNYVYCDQRGAPPYDLCVFGPLDHAKGVPPKRYSTWLGINERGDVGNILFFMVKGNPNTKPNSVGQIAGSYIQDSSWPSAEAFMANLTANKTFYRPFNYVQMAMSKETGQYDLFYVNNNDTESYKKMNPNDQDQFFFSLSNSDPNRAFRKVGEGEKLMSKLVYMYGTGGGARNRQKLVDSLLYELLQNTTENMPDPNLAAFTGANEETVRGVSRVNADYGGFWKNAHTRTSTVILVDKYDNVEYHELNLTSWRPGVKISDQKWVLNSFKFKLRPSYTADRQSNSTNSGSGGSVAGLSVTILTTPLLLLAFLFNMQ